MKTIINFFSGLFKQNFSHAEKSAGRSNETVQEKNREDRWKAQTDPVIRKLSSKVRADDYEGVFEMLENGTDPNLPLYDIFSDSIDNGLDHVRYEATYHVLDYVSDKAMIKLLRSYGAKTSREMAEDEWKKREQERAKNRNTKRVPMFWLTPC